MKFVKGSTPAVKRSDPRRIVTSVRTMFIFYVLLIALGVVVYVVVGLTQP